MDRESLRLLVAKGESVERIAKRFGKHPSTVSYWMAKHDLVAGNREEHACAGRAFAEAPRGTRSGGTDTLRAEANKCILLRANCDAEVESGALGLAIDSGRLCRRS